MAIYRFILALLVGIAFTALLALSLNIPSFLFVIPAILLLAPGGIVQGLFSSLHGVFSPLPMLLADSVIYSALAYFLFRRWLRAEAVKATLLAIAAPPVMGLAYLACLPTASPLWPLGMSQLSEEESSLRHDLPVGSSLDAARAVLRGRGIQSSEEEVGAEEVVFQDATMKMVAERGERIVSARIPTDAGQFPCGYRIDVALVFDKNNKLERSRIQRFHICP